MITRPAISVLLAAASAAAFAAPAFTGGLRAPSSNDREIVLAGGMSGGSGGMGGGNFGGMRGGAGGMGGGNFVGMSGGAGGMSGGNFGDSRSGGPVSDFGQADRGFSGAGTASDDYTYHYPQRIAHGARHSNTRALTGDTTAQLNRQELARHRSAAETPDNPILEVFKSLFH